MQNDLARNTHNIEPSICQADLTLSGNDLGNFHSSHSGAILSGLTGIHHSVGYVMGCRIQRNFILQSNSTLEPTDTDQIHTNAI